MAIHLQLRDTIMAGQRKPGHGALRQVAPHVAPYNGWPVLIPIALVTAYLAINFAMIVWLAREEAHGRSVPPSAALLYRAMRWGPLIVGFLYLVTIAGDWPYVLFVGGFFALAFWLLDSLLNYPPPPRR